MVNTTNYKVPLYGPSNLSTCQFVLPTSKPFSNGPSSDAFFTCAIFYISHEDNRDDCLPGCEVAVNTTIWSTTSFNASRTVPGSIPGGVTGDFFTWLPPTGPCALGSNQPLKMSTRDFSWDKGGRGVWLTTYHP